MARSLFPLLCACLVAGFPLSAEAFELSGGVSVGGLVVGIIPRLAVSPHASVAWRTDAGIRFGVQEMFSVLPHSRGVGVYSQTATDLGYAWENINLSLGPSLAVYTMPACKPGACRRVEGVSPGIHLQASIYFAGPLGLSVWGGVDWHVGDSDILAGQVTAVLVAGPLLRWRTT